jgi:hypothetical protein
MVWAATAQKENIMPEDVQPTEGQGGEATGGLFDSYLQTVPEQAREAAETWFRDTSKGLDSKLEEAAEFRKAWEPYQNVELLRQYEPNELAELLGWHQQVKQEDGYREFIANAAAELGLTPAEEKELEAAEADGELSRAEIEQLITQQAEARVAPLAERLEQWETERAVDAEDQNIRSEFERLESEHTISLSKDQKAIVLDLGMNHQGQGSWVQAGFDRFRSMTTEAQKAFVEEKAKAPPSALEAGGVERFKPSMTFDEAAARTKERLRQSQT